MDSPEPGSIRIRLAIDIPPGAGGGAAPPPRVVALGAPLQDFQNPSPPDNPNGPWSVLPDATTGLGTICGEVTFADEKENVWALVYPALHYPANPSPSHPRPASAVRGVSTDRHVWRWGAANAAPGAAHTAAGAPNRFAVWFQTTSSSAEVFDGASAFKGVTDAVPCGSGGGSGSGMLAGELAGAAVLRVTVPNGTYAGTYLATRVATLKWVVGVGGVSYTIESANGQCLSIRGGTTFVASTASSGGPFSATFHGHTFGSTADVVVTIA